jgi:protein TonB
MDLTTYQHPITKHATMKQDKILGSDLIDIIFDDRNKEYGAYALRKGYDNRMMTALGTGLLLVVIFIVATAAGKKKEVKEPDIPKKEEMLFRTVVMPMEKIKAPEAPKEPVKQKPVKKRATIKYTTPPVIKKDNAVTTPMVPNKELDNKDIAAKTEAGKTADKVVVTDKPAIVTSTGTGTAGSGASQPDFVAEEKDPEFPGGTLALRQFLSRNLDTPEDLENGEKKLVRIKFQVGKDGTVTAFEIVTSAGNEFDSEVVRVCKKMPRWKPAVQNGINVPVSYVLPVTFIGVDE